MILAEFQLTTAQAMNKVSETVSAGLAKVVEALTNSRQGKGKKGNKAADALLRPAGKPTGMAIAVGINHESV